MEENNEPIIELKTVKKLKVKIGKVIKLQPISLCDKKECKP